MDNIILFVGSENNIILAKKIKKNKKKIIKGDKK